MIKVVSISFIPGFMVGIEWAYDQGFFVIDLGIVRVAIDYIGWQIK